MTLSMFPIHNMKDCEKRLQAFEKENIFNISL